MGGEWVNFLSRPKRSTLFKQKASKVAKKNTQEQEQKVDGRKQKRGPRPIYFLCAAIQKDGLTYEQIQKADRDDAIKEFTANHKAAPSMVEGPFYRVLGASAAPEGRATVSLKLSELEFSKSRWEGQFKGWKVIAHGIEATGQYGDDELVYLFVGDRADPQSEAPALRFGQSEPVIPFSLLENAKPLS
jgi:hypothetical protein